MSKSAHSEFKHLFSVFEQELSCVGWERPDNIEEQIFDNSGNVDTASDSVDLIDISLPDSFLHDVEVPSARQLPTNLEQPPKAAVEAVALVMEELKRLRSLMHERYEKFKDITISFDLYEELRKKPINTLTIHELASLRANEYHFTVKNELESLRLYRGGAEREQERLQALVRAQEAEMSTHRKLMAISEEGHSLEMAALEDKLSRMKTQLETESKLRALYEDKAYRFDNTAQELAHTSEDSNRLKAVLAQQTIALDKLSSSEAVARRAAEDAETAKRLLEQDKAFLSQEVLRLQALLDDRSRANEHLKAQTATLELKVAQLTDQLLAVQLNAKNSFEERIEKEVSRLREEASKDVELVKQNTKDAMDRETRMLRDMLSSATADNEQLKRKNENLSSENNSIIRELAIERSEKSNELSEVRSELKLKSFENITLGAKYEEKAQQLNALLLELDIVKQELQVHKNAIMKSEVDATHRENKLRQDNENLRRKMMVYETLESDIDESVEKIAVNGLENDNETSRLLLQLSRNPERRIQQAVRLAHRLLTVEKDKEAIQKQLSEVKLENAAYEEKLAKALEDLTRVTQPSSYLVLKLREEEAAKIAWISRSKAAEDSLTAIKRERDLAVAEAENLGEKLRALIKQRSEIEALRELVEAWQHAQDDDAQSQVILESSAVDEGIQTSDSSSVPIQTYQDPFVSFAELGLTPQQVSKMLTPPGSTKKQTTKS